MQQSDKFSRCLVLDPYHRGKKWETGPRKTKGWRELPVWCPGVLTFPDKGTCKGQGLSAQCQEAGLA